MDDSLSPQTAQRLRRGDLEAIEEVVDALHAPIYRYLLSSGSTVAEAEDLTAETFFQVLRSVSNFRGDDDQVRAFVFATARNVRANHFRRRSRNTETIDCANSIANSDDSPVAQLLAQECHSNVASAIQRLSEISREIVLLRFVEDLSITEIASVCGMPEGTVKSHLHRAKQTLKHELSDLEPLK